MQKNNESRPLHVTLLRRFAAITYDSIAVLAVLFFGTLPIVIVMEGEAIAAENPFYFIYLLILAFLYFAICWTRGGQTLGMRTWKIRVSKENGDPLTVFDALKRFSLAMVSWLFLGLGFLSALTNERKLAWHDKYSRTFLQHCD
ncbi:MAG: RDD family protein [Gammaproteobacteria bacterium]